MSDYVIMKLAEQRSADLRAEAEKERLAASLQSPVALTGSAAVEPGEHGGASRTRPRPYPAAPADPLITDTCPVADGARRYDP